MCLLTVCNLWILALINLSDEDFKYLVKEVGSENLELLKQKVDYPYKYMNSFERRNEEKLPAIFTVLQRMKKLVMMVKYQTFK